MCTHKLGYHRQLFVLCGNTVDNVGRMTSPYGNLGRNCVDIAPTMALILPNSNISIEEYQSHPFVLFAVLFHIVGTWYRIVPRIVFFPQSFSNSLSKWPFFTMSLRECGEFHMTWYFSCRNKTLMALYDTIIFPWFLPVVDSHGLFYFLNLTGTLTAVLVRGKLSAK